MCFCRTEWKSEFLKCKINVNCDLEVSPYREIINEEKVSNLFKVQS